MIHTHTVSAQHLRLGDRIYESGREVSRSVRDVANLEACIVTYIDGTVARMGAHDAVAIDRDEAFYADAPTLTLSGEDLIEALYLIAAKDIDVALLYADRAGITDRQTRDYIAKGV